MPNDHVAFENKDYYIEVGLTSVRTGLIRSSSCILKNATGRKSDP